MTASGLESPSPRPLTGSSWVTPVIRIVTWSSVASASTTPSMLTGTILWFGGQRWRWLGVTLTIGGHRGADDRDVWFGF